jgi:hypothetical protein
LLRLTLRELGLAAGLPVEASVQDSLDVERHFDLPMWRLRARFSSEAAFKAYVRRKLDEGAERALVRRIAAIFDA